MNLKTIMQYTSCIVVSVALTACGSSTSENDMISGNDSANSTNPVKDTKAQNVFNTIPSPVETTSLLKSAGAKYNAKLLNPIENVSKYSSIISKALNLGVYGTDLSFTSIFDQTQESMLYLRCTNKLSSSLGISGAFDEATTSRIEANMDNRDSLLTIISDSYWTSDTYLKNNGQAGISALIVAGGWIEGLYIATQIANTTKNEGIVTRIGEQKTSLGNLVTLLDSYKTENPGANDLLASLKELKTIYDGLEGSAETSVNTDTDTSKTSAGNTAIVINPEQLKQITEKATEIRNKIIK